MNDECDVMILGAGAAGLTAATALSADARVIVLEARDRVGGRLHTRRHAGQPLPVELGPEFVHGHMPETFARLGPAGLVAYEVVDQHQGARSGRPLAQDNLWEQAGELLARVESIREGDLSFADFLTKHAKRATPAVRNMARMFVEGYNAADASDISCRSLAKASAEEAKHEDGDKQYRLIGGYDQLAQSLAREIRPPSRIELSTVVKTVRWRRGRVEASAITPRGERRFVARSAIIALPLGVLQAPPDAPAGVRFEPELPTRRLIAEGLTMGSVTKLTLGFREAFWERGPFKDLAFVHRADLPFPTWWSMRPLRTNRLIAWAGGRASTLLDGVDAGRRSELAIDSLAEILAMPRRRVAEQLVEVDARDWQQDPFSCGSYSYARVGAADAPERIARPIEGTLFFAGEHTHGGLLGTVAGAIHTGTAAAKRVLRLREGASPPRRSDRGRSGS